MGLLCMSSSSPWTKSRNSVIFCLISIIQGLLVILLEASIMIMIGVNLELIAERSSKASPIPIYLLLFILSQIFQVLLSVESVFFKNTLQIIGVVVFNLLTLVYSVFQYFQISRDYTATQKGDFMNLSHSLMQLVAAVAACIVVGQLLLSWFGLKLYKEFGWTIYRRLGSDLTMRECFMTYHLLLMFLKFDVFFFFGFLLQFLTFTISVDDYELWITLGCIPLSLVVALAAKRAVQQENLRLTIFSLIGLFVGIPYFSFKIVRFVSLDKYDGYRNFLTLFATISLLVNTTSFSLLIACFRNYGKGLSPYIQISWRPRDHQPTRPLTLNLEGE